MVSTWVPFLKMSRRGMEEMLNLMAVAWFSSVSSFPTLISPLEIFASSSTMGPMRLQGPHQGAQQSTRTLVFPSMTASNISSVISVVIISSCPAIIPNRIKSKRRYP